MFLGFKRATMWGRGGVLAVVSTRPHPRSVGSEPRRVSWLGGKERVSAAAAAGSDGAGRVVPSPHPVKNKQIVSLWSDGERANDRSGGRSLSGRVQRR